MAVRFFFGALYTILALLALAITVAYCQPVAAQMTHEQYHPEWIRKSGCCGPHDTRKVRVAYLPSGWHIVWIDNPPGYPVIRLTRPLRFDLATIRRSQDGNWWAGMRVVDGVAVGIWVIDKKRCVFGHGSGQ